MTHPADAERILQCIPWMSNIISPVEQPGSYLLKRKQTKKFAAVCSLCYDYGVFLDSYNQAILRKVEPMSGFVQSTVFELTHPEGAPIPQEAKKALEKLAKTNNREVRGAVYTRSEVVNFILDLIGFTDEQPLFKKRILEPSFGNGDFLLPLLDRLLASWKRHSPSGDHKELQHALVGE